MPEKRYFRINPGKLGSYLRIGSVSKEFIEYWDGREESELIEHLLSAEEMDESEGFEPDSPPPTPDWEGSWLDCDDLARVHAPFAECAMTVEEVTLRTGVSYLNGEIISDIKFEDLDDMYDVIDRP